MPDNTVIGNINTIETTAGTAIKSSNCSLDNLIADRM